MGSYRSHLLALLLPLVVASTSACRSKGEGQDVPSAKPSAAAVEVRIEGIDTSGLTPRERREWAAQVSELLAPCPDTPVSVAQCAMEKRACKTCVPAAELMLRLVRSGLAKKEREEAFRARFDPQKVRAVEVGDSAALGPADAAVTIVEWADFQCPHCRAMYPLLEQLAKRYPEQVRFVFKFYPLRMHPQGMVAAKAAAAAAEQGKFWEMHHLLFDRSDHLEASDLEGYAKQVGLDVEKFKAAIAAPATEEKIARDQKQAEALGLEGTPFLYINGREVALESLQQPFEDLERWVRLELELAGKTPKAVELPAAPATAAPSASAATQPAAPATAAPSASAATQPAAASPGH